ncbi:MAG: HEAT repeat domain-containing protein, partial [Planctomycetota bacterium]
FKEDFKKKSIGFKKRAIEALPTTDERTIHFIIKGKKLLQSKDWWIRGTACDRLARIQVAELRKVLHSYYYKESNVQIREGVITALGMIKHRADPPVILDALKDKAWQVRRMACIAAGQQRIKDAVPIMIDMIHEEDRAGNVLNKGEPHPRVHNMVLWNLWDIVGKNFDADRQQWKMYWAENKDKQLQPPKRFDYGTFAGVKLKYNDTFARRGTGPLCIVLPQVHYTAVYYMPYFSQITFMKWIFVDLPPMGAFPNVERDRDGDVIYPIDQLVDAFEDMRKKYNVDRAAILAQGFSTWIAAKYAQKYPDHVLGLILLNAYASNETFSKRIDELLRSDNPDYELWAKVSRKLIRPGSALEWERYNYVRDTAKLKDTSDVEIQFLRRIWRDPTGVTIMIPDFDIRGERTTQVPTLLFFAPKSNIATGIDGMRRMRRYYKNAYTVRLKQSARLPFMEEPEKFTEFLKKFRDDKLMPRLLKDEAKEAKRRQKEATEK